MIFIQFFKQFLKRSPNEFCEFYENCEFDEFHDLYEFHDLCDLVIKSSPNSHRDTRLPEIVVEEMRQGILLKLAL